MTTQQIHLVQESMNKILPISQESGQLFYQRLFEIAPQLKPLFNTDIPTQSRKLMSILIHIVANLDRLENIQSELTQLGDKHIAYKVKTAHYDFVGEALFYTIQHKISNDWNTELETAWRLAYQKIVIAMT